MCYSLKILTGPSLMATINEMENIIAVENNSIQFLHSKLRAVSALTNLAKKQKTKKLKFPIKKQKQHRTT